MKIGCMCLVAAAIAGCTGGGNDNGAAREPALDCASLVTTAAPEPFSPGSFGRARGPNFRVRAIAVPENTAGAIVLGGDFDTVDNRGSSRIARLSRTGVFDPGFATGTGFNSRVLAFASSRDGSGDIYATGLFTTYNGAPTANIVRLNCDGSVDKSFAAGSGLDGPASPIAFVNDGSGDVFVGGGFSKYQGTPTGHMVRLRPDGSRNAGFVFPQGGTPVYAIASVDDGSHDVYVARGYGLERYNSAGQFKWGYLFDGDSGNEFSLIEALAAAQDQSGDVYAAGEFIGYDRTPSRYLVRINGDGTIDTAFDVGVTGFNNVVLTVAAATDGSGDVYVGGWFTTYKGLPAPHIARLKADGSLAPTFVTGRGFDNIVRTIRVAPDGSGDIYVGGEFAAYNGTGADRVARLHSNGAIATELAVPSRFNDPVHALALAPDGSGDLYAGGAFSTFNGKSTNCIAKLRPDGTVDPAFASGEAFASTDPSAPGCGVIAIVDAGDATGDIYAVGDFNNYNGTPVSRGLVRLGADGTLIRAFSLSATIAVAALEDSTGRLYAAGGFSEYNGAPAGRIIRLNPDGTTDSGFNSGSGFSGAFNGYVLALALAPDGSGDIFVGSDYNITTYDGASVAPVVRLRPDGTRDTSFNADVRLRFSYVRAVAPARDGSGAIYLAGDFRNDDNGASNNIVRLNRDGSIDPSFAVGIGFTSFTTSLLVDATGAIYVGGGGGMYNGTYTGGQMVRLKADGTLDADFQSAGTFLAWSMIDAGDGSGDLYVGGGSGGYGGFSGWTVDGIVRIRADGTPR